MRLVTAQPDTVQRQSHSSSWLSHRETIRITFWHLGAAHGSAVSPQADTTNIVA